MWLVLSRRRLRLTCPLWKALRIAQRRLKPEVRDRLLGVVSSRIVSGQLPTAWRFVFFDAGTSGSQRVVTVAANGSSEQPETQELFNQRRLPLIFEIIDLKRVRLEGTDAVKLAATMVQVKARELELSLFQQAGNPEPRWLVRFYAAIESPPLEGGVDWSSYGHSIHLDGIVFSRSLNNRLIPPLEDQLLVLLDKLPLGESGCRV